LYQNALKALQSENEGYLREHARIVGRMEAISREYDDMRHRAMEAEEALNR